MLNRLDNALLRAAQYIVDRIGGDYVGQRIARQLGYACSIGHILSFLLDYRWSGAALTPVCLFWTINLWWVKHCYDSAVSSMRDGFMNPYRDPLQSIPRLIQAVWLMLLVALNLVDTDPLQIMRVVSFACLAAFYYFLATDNPPPKKAEAKEDVTSLKPAFEQP